MQRIIFRFAGDFEIRYLRDAPVVGDFVSHRADLWIVASARENRTGEKIVICELPPGNGGHGDHHGRRAA